MVKKLQKAFISYCNSQQLEVNSNQIDVINKLEKYYQNSFLSYFSKLFSKKFFQKGFYLYGGVGVGKTMILNFFLII
jgi:cell division protein ZapE